MFFCLVDKKKKEGRKKEWAWEKAKH